MSLEVSGNILTGVMREETCLLNTVELIIFLKFTAVEAKVTKFINMEIFNF